MHSNDHGTARIAHATRVFEQTDLACFVAGTQIETPAGPRAVESLTPGDLVDTADHGPQPLRRMLSKTVPGDGPLAPVCFAAGTLGNRRDLMVSPQHRMLVTGWQAELIAGEAEVLVPALALATGNDRVYRRPMPRVTYVHLLFDRHEIIFAEGAATESYHPLSQDAPATRDELRALFPELWQNPRDHQAARPCLSAPEAALIRL